MIEWIKSFEFTSLMGIVLYWLPASLCVYGYTVRTWLNFQKDTKARAEAARPSNYYPTDNMGDLIGRAVVAVVPIANIWAAAFDVAPKMCATMFNWIGRVFDAPLVPRRNDKPE
jgi:hypothetical protein